ncbi:MAG: Ig-like domain-containing protein [Gammaproteobacteria bacterium]|nr:Ig-like domain-containing protein [Gammaproteobacteria bacterium]MDE0259564.1 Ig-like domain-containing protein [Gammaproteobacteria bacterium]
MTPAAPAPPVPTTVAISPTSAAFHSIGDSLRMIATVSDQYGQEMTNVAVAWSSSDASVATVTEGLVTAVGNGSATVTATVEAATASAEVAVDQSVAELAVSPAAHTLVAIGDTVRFVAEARDGNGHVVTGAEFVWSSDDESVVTVDAQGLATAAVNGVARVTATSGSQSASAEVTVEQEVTEVSVSRPPTVLEAFGDTLRLSAESVDANGHAVVGTVFTWTSGDTLVAVVDSAGLVTAVGNGKAEIVAAAGPVSGTASVTVAQKLGTVAVSPSTGTLEALGDTVRLSAVATDDNGHQVSGTAFMWSSRDTLVVEVDIAGLVTAVGNGTTSVVAVAGEALDEAIISVMQSAASVIVAPATDSIAPRDTLRLSAEVMDANGHAVSGARVRWSSSDRSVATVGASGLVRGVTEGTATIKAVAGTAHGSAQITVFNPDRAVLVALYEATDGPNWVNSENWLTEAPLRDWYGVIAYDQDRVWGLRLRENGLSGPIPSELSSLTYLQGLNLERNALEGPIPPDLGGLTGLRRLILGANALSGPIPAELGNTSLEDLWLGGNNLAGPMPRELGKLKNLRFLDVADNPDLRGEIPNEVLALNLDFFESYATGLCVPRTGDFESYISRDGWVGYVCGETDPGFQIQLLFHPDVPAYIREVWNSEAEYWMEILRQTEAPDVFGESPCHLWGWEPSLPDPIIDDLVVTVSMGEGHRGGICGLPAHLRQRVTYAGGVTFDSVFVREIRTHPDRAELLKSSARHELAHVLGIGTLWRTRGHLKNASTAERVLDTYVVLPLATRAFDAAGGASYTGPKIPVHQLGPGRNGHWRGSMFGRELMTPGNGRLTSAVTLQSLADFGYKVDLSLADPYRLPSAASLGADASLFKPYWEAPPAVVVCRRRSQLQTGREGLSTGSSPSARPVSAPASGHLGRVLRAIPSGSGALMDGDGPWRCPPR